MNEQNDFWGDTPDWTESAERPGRQQRADETRPSGRPGTFGSKLKNLWGSAMSSRADATREHRVLDASQLPPEPAGMFDDLDEPDEFDRIEPTTAAPVAAGTLDGAGFTAAPTGWSGDDWFGDDVVDVEIEAFAPTYVGDQRAERRTGGIDPLLTRIAAAAVVLTLGVPLAIGLSSGDEPSDLIASADIANTNNEPVISLAPQASQPPVLVTDPATEVYLDPSQLPPAIPVNTEPASEASAPQESSSEAADSTAEPSAEATASVSSDEMSTDTNDSTASETAPDSGAISQPVDAGDTADRVAPNCATDYTVVEGDFWIRLADAAGVELAELLEANGATVNTPLFPGSDICLPAGAATPAPPTTAAPAVTSPATTSTTTTSSTSTTTSTTTTTVPPSPAGPEDIKQIIRDVWPDELEERALEIAYRESRYVPTAKNFCCYGLFQMYWTVHQSWLADIGITNDQQLYDPETNARAAYALYQRAGGWGPWAL